MEDKFQFEYLALLKSYTFPKQKAFFLPFSTSLLNAILSLFRSYI
jgi:hypothetical protein